jgi:ribose-phosphate pyrophosphokinase
MIDTGGTLINAIDMLKRHKAKKVYIGATHPLFSGDAINKMQSSGVDEIVVLDTMPIKKKYDPNIIKVLSIAPLLAKTIKKVYYCKSVSELFKGENLV